MLLIVVVRGTEQDGAFAATDDVVATGAGGHLTIRTDDGHRCQVAVPGSQTGVLGDWKGCDDEGRARDVDVVDSLTQTGLHHGRRRQRRHVKDDVAIRTVRHRRTHGGVRQLRDDASGGRELLCEQGDLEVPAFVIGDAHHRLRPVRGAFA